jgi:hypothetical protein
MKLSGSSIAEFGEARKSLESFTEYAAKPGYGQMMSELRGAAIRLKANPKDVEAEELIKEAAWALKVPRTDLLALARMPADAVAAGNWRPRSVNVDLVEPDPTTRNGPESKFQKKLNDLSEKIMPTVKEVRIPGLHAAYQVGAAFLPVVDELGRQIANPIDAAGHVVREWSDSLATDVQLKLRDVRAATKPSGLKMGEVAQLNELEQRAFLFAAEKLSGMALDADQFIDWARDPKAAEMSQDLAGRLKNFASNGLYGLANFLRGTAAGVRNATDMDGWRTFTVHLQFGAGVEKYTVSMRGGFTIMFPTLEQAEREGKASVRVVSRLNPVETMFGGLSLTSRGGGMKFRAGPVGAKISEFEHEVKAGIPGIIGISVGEDYAYGPSVAFGYSPPIGILAALPLPLTIRAGGEITVFHPAFSAGARGTRKAAEKISIFCDDTATAIKKLGNKNAATEAQDGWPVRQRWNISRRATERAEVASSLAQERLSALRSIGPQQLSQPERAKKLLGRDADKSLETFNTITRYLESISTVIDKETAAVRKLAGEASAGKNIDKKSLARLTDSLTRHALAFEYVDVLVSAMIRIAEEEKADDSEAQNTRPLAANE